MSEPVFYTTLEGEGEAEFVEKKSVFISHAKPIQSEEEALAYIKKIKSAYADARHNVWAYMMKGEIIGARLFRPDESVQSLKKWVASL